MVRSTGGFILMIKDHGTIMRTSSHPFFYYDDNQGRVQGTNVIDLLSDYLGYETGVGVEFIITLDESKR